jgi:hypothetical protein
MPNPTLTRLLQKIGNPDLIEELTNQLSLSELNSLLLEIMNRKTTTIFPATLLKQYRQNRFVTPSAVDSLSFSKMETPLLELAQHHHFNTLELSPLAPIGNCSVMGAVNQNKVVSALRGTEVVADATNLLALEAVTRRKSNMGTEAIALCAVHRHVRAQALPPIKGFSAHFKLFCAVTAGRDTGNLEFEKQSLLAHLRFYQSYFHQLGLTPIKITLKLFGDSSGELEAADRIAAYVMSQLSDDRVTKVTVPHSEHLYYSRLRFSLNLIHQGNEINLGDGGFVDWGQKLTGNNKEKMFTSGLGIELLIKIMKGTI